MNINMNAWKIQALSLKGANYLIEIYFAKTKQNKTMKVNSLSISVFIPFQLKMLIQPNSFVFA